MDRNNIGPLLIALLGAFAVAIPVTIRSSGPASPQVETPLTTPSGDRPLAAYEIIKYFFGFTDKEAYEAWTDQPDARKGYEIEFVIATLPEPIASPLRSKFDSYLDAIQSAAETAGYVLDRFNLPWQVPEKGSPQGFALGQQLVLRWEEDTKDGLPKPTGSFVSVEGNKKEQTRFLTEPGILLFRHNQEKKLLLVLVVGETPTWGVRKEALANALDLVSWLSNYWPDKPPQRFPEVAKGPPQIRILGPSFSGSAKSIDLALDAWLATHQPLPLPQVTIISGTATAVRDEFEPKGRFTATTVSDSQRNHLIECYLMHLGANHIALLSESGTLRGFHYSSEAHPHAMGDASADSGCRNAPLPLGPMRVVLDWLGRRPPPAPRILYLKYPLHISNLRNASRSAATPATPQLALGRRNLPFSEEQSEAGGYVIPTFSSREAYYDELVLDRLLSTIHRERIKYVEIVATDNEDLIFLAQQIRSKCPDTVIVSLSEDLRFLHSDVNQDLRGMLVFSTYPLFSANQSWTYPFTGEGQRFTGEGQRFIGEGQRSQFPSDNAEGVYNATLALLGKAESMLEYSIPFEKLPTKPPLWVSIVGTDDFWPVAYMPIDDDPGEVLYPAGLRPPPKGPIEVASALYPRPFLIGFLLMSLFSLAASLSLLKESSNLRVSSFFARFFWLWNWVPASLSMLWGDAVIPGNRPMRRTILFECATILLVLYAIVFFYYLLPWLPGSGFKSDVVSWHPSVLVETLAVTACITLSLQLLAVFTTLVGACAAATSISRKVGLVAVLPFSLVAAYSVTELTVNFKQPSIIERPSIFAFLRSVDLRSGVSPLVPILLMGGAGLVLVLCSLRRLNLLEQCPLPSPFLNLKSTSFEGVTKLEDQIIHLLECSALRLPGLPLLLPAFFAIWAALHQGRASYPVDGPAFDYALFATSVLVYAGFLAVFLRFTGVWLSLRSLLRRLYWHPTRGSYESLRESLPGDQTARKRIYLVEPRPTYAAMEASLQSAREIQQRVNLPYLRVAVDCAERCLLRAYKLETGATDNWRESVSARLHAERTVAIVTGAVASIFDGEWRLAGAAQTASRSDQEVVTELIRQANLCIAARVVDFLRQVLAQLQNLALFGTTGMLLMLLAMSSYPFPQRDTLLWLSWATLLGAVLLLLIVFVQMNRDRIISLLSGTTPGKLEWDSSFLIQVTVFGVVPILTLLGAQFPQAFGQLFSWASKLGSGGH